MSSFFPFDRQKSSKQTRTFPKSRSLTLESLEERDYLSVAPLTGLPKMDEPVVSDWFESVQEYESYATDPSVDKSSCEQWILQLDENVLTSVNTVTGASDLLSNCGITVLSGLGSPGLLLVQVEAETLQAQTEILVGLDCLEYWQPNYLVTSDGVAQEINDPKAESQWALDVIDVSSAWSTSTGTGVVVAVLDSGITLTHPDLKSNIWINTAEMAGDGIDNDGNGFIDDVYGWNFVAKNSNVTDNDGHGTHVAGIIGAVANNNLGGAGAAPDVQILPIKVVEGTSGSTGSIVLGVNYLLDLKSRGVNIAVVNMSLGYYSEDIAVRSALARAADAGIVIVTSAGNSANNNDYTSHYPSEYATQLGNVISVASIDQNGQLASNSNYGAKSVDLAAPGVSIYSTTRNGSYGYMSGTSMAAPFVAAAAALIAANEPDLSPGEIKTRILESTVPLTSLTGKVATGGRLDLAGLFSASAHTPPTAPSELGVIAINGNQLTLQWRDNSLNETGFEIQASSDSGRTWSTIRSDVAANETSCTVAINPGTVYLYRIRAVNESGNSAWSGFATTLSDTVKKPGTPAGVKAKAVDDQSITVSWKAVNTATAYRVERALSTKGEWEEIYIGSELSVTDTELDSSTKYYYRVFAINVSVSSSAGSTVSATTTAIVPNTPENVAASLLDATTVKISWDAVPHATSYRVEYYDAAKNRWLSAGTSTTDAYLHRSRSPSTTYRYRVVAISKAGESAASSTVEITTPVAVPTKPTGFKGNVYDATTIEFHWNSDPRATSWRIEYSLTGKTNDWLILESGITDPAFKATGLPAGMKLYFRLVATNGSGDSAVSAVYSTTMPALAPEGAPATVTATAENSTQVRISWTAVKNATKYVVERSTNGTKWTKVKTVAASQTDLLLSGHKASTEYFYRVTATSSAGSGGPSEVVNAKTRLATPAAPRLSVLDSETIRVSWTALKGADGYRIERAMEGSILWDTVAELGTGTLSFVDDECVANTSYSYRVVALSEEEGIESASSKEASIRSAPESPSEIEAVEVTGKQITLIWNECQGAVRYTVQRFVGTAWKNVGSTKTNEFTIKSLQSETEYLFRVIAVGKDGSSEPGEEIEVETSMDVPATPGGLKTYAMDADAVALTWKEADRAESYDIYRYDKETKSWELVADSVTDLFYFDDGLDASTRYQYRIYAVNDTGQSVRAASGNATTLKESIGSVAPDMLEILSESAKVLKIGFETPEEGSQTYRIQWSTDGELWSSQKTFITTQATVVVSGLKPETEYFFRIRLEKGKNVSDWSDVFEFSTL